MAIATSPGFGRPKEQVIVSGKVVTASAEVAQFEMPNDITDVRIVVTVTVASGTTPTLDVLLQITGDDGLTWFYSGNKFLQQTAASTRQIILSRAMGAGQTASEAPGDNPAIGAAAAAVNGPVSRRCRLFGLVGGTTPSFTINAFLLGNRIVGA